ncbi:SRPBCC family protein [Streptomyces sp. NPDC050658]|uniref:SRPBCC family protein n=1 Tax=unclassified Streptomyces TaxID=2593676 RepID=UPI00341E26D3
MWNDELHVEADVTQAAVWARCVDVATWPDWNPGLEKVELEGAFTAGQNGVIFRAGAGEIPFSLLSVVDGESFVVESPMDGGIVHRIGCQVTALPGGGSRMTHKVELDGPGSDELAAAIGSELSKNLSTVAEALIKAAS